ncbi:Glutamyl-tRNA synthetase [Entomortierella beljakovae]|nr:Glutamyl-tRNA synthetase [Entomortierella beljakovae]
MHCSWNRLFRRSGLSCQANAHSIHKAILPTSNTCLPSRISYIQKGYYSSGTDASTGTGTTRVRFAPSPTGYLHLGGLRTALYNYLIARQEGGKCILRIEDTDQTRYVPGAAESLTRALEWAGVKFDEGPGIGGPHAPYHQRLTFVRLEAQKSGRTASYDRKCTLLSKEESQERANNGEQFVVRMKIPVGKTIIEDEVHGKVEFSNKEIDDSILMKSDGYPTYHLANVVDDHLMGISHVIRGQVSYTSTFAIKGCLEETVKEWLPSAPKHVLLYKMFGWNAPKFAHVPLLLNQDKSKLSKRTGDVNVEDYRDKGYFPEAVANFVALLGWHPGTTEEIFDMDGLIKAFSLKNIQQSNAVVLREKLDWINKMHLLRRAETQEGLLDMAKILRPKIEADLGINPKDVSDDYIARVIWTLKERIKNLHDVTSLCSYYFLTPTYSSEESIAYRNKVGDETLRTVLPMALEKFNSGSGVLSKEDVKATLQEIADKHKFKLPVVMNALRYTVSGVKVGAGVPETLATLGRSCVVDRIQHVLPKIK